jgi:tetratricopeptide (TPR) repeat protein
MKNLFLHISILLIIAPALVTRAQSIESERAQVFFQEGNHEAALEIYERMLTLFPRDMQYKYYTGACLVEVSRDPTRAISLLEASRPHGSQVLFYLARAYHLHLDLDKAKETMEEYIRVGNKLEVARSRARYYLEQIENARILTRSVKEVEIFEKASLAGDEWIKHYNQHLEDQKLEIKPVIFRSQADQRESNQSLIVLDNKPVPGQYAYTSGYTVGKRGGKEITRHRYLPNGSWIGPENLGKTINSQLDEDYAYYHAATGELFFSSKGHNSMGGYDIFRSVWDPATNTWSKPENLGFPINTPYDDFLLVPTPDQTTFLFSSNRDGKKGQITVYQAHYPSIDRSRVVKQGENLRLLSQLEINARAPETKKTQLVTPAIQSKTPSPEGKDLYGELITQALQLQLRADSFSRAALETRVLINQATRQDEKNKLWSRYNQLDKRAKEIQAEADDRYTKAREIELSNRNQSSRENQPPAGDLVKSVFSEQRTPRDAKEIGNPGQKASPEKTSEVKDGPNSSLPLSLSRFEIYPRSPYTDRQPIQINPTLPTGLLYRIQLGVFSKPVGPEHFRGLFPITGETIQNGALTKYYVGMLFSLREAEIALQKVREYGYKDSFVVACFNGQVISTTRAKQLEQD